VTLEDPSLAASGVVIDANVVAKWFLEEESSDRARSLLDSGLILAAPDLLIPELGSVFREKVRALTMTPTDAALAVEVALERVVLVPSEDGFVGALDIALAASVSFYDALYVALARNLGVELVTDDAKLMRTLGQNFNDVIRPLGEYAV
jgi:predicted nucleic acid-binding protein